MTATMLVMAMLADGVAAGGGVHALHHRAPTARVPIASLPVGAVDAWPLRRCGDDVPGTQETAAEAAIDDACPRLVVRDSVRYLPGRARWQGNSGSGGGDTRGWQLARAILPGLEGLQGLVGPGGLGLGIGSELQFVRGAHMTLHLAAARDTRIAVSRFAPETTVQARCGACWDTGEAVGAGINGGRRVSGSAADR